MYTCIVYSYYISMQNFWRATPPPAPLVPMPMPFTMQSPTHAYNYMWLIQYPSRICCNKSNDVALRSNVLAIFITRKHAQLHVSFIISACFNYSGLTDFSK